MSVRCTGQDTKMCTDGCARTDAHECARTDAHKCARTGPLGLLRHAVANLKATPQGHGSLPGPPPRDSEPLASPGCIAPPRIIYMKH